MFLRPQHFQMAQRYWAFSATQGNRWDLQYGWGIRTVEIDRDALTNFRCVVRRVQARLRDGTIINIPEEGKLNPVDLTPSFQKASTVTAFLAVPTLRSGQPNLQENPDDTQTRYRVTTQEMTDENTGINAQPIQVRQLNVQLLVTPRDTRGYEVLPVGRFKLSADANATPELETEFFPPVLACDAWEPLHFQILHNLCERLSTKIELLAGRLVGEGISFDTEGEGHQQTLFQLHELNQAATTLDQFRSIPGVHPLWLYTELCRVVGKLAIFGSERRPPPLPHYDHDDLGGCLHALKRIIDGYLDSFVEPEYRHRGFVGIGAGLQADLEPAWLEPGRDLYIGVKSKLNSARVVDLLGQGGQLNMKIGSAERADTIFRLAQEGLHFSHVANPPRVLPTSEDVVYFRISRDASNREWSFVQTSLTLAVRINVNALSGDIQGKRAVTIRLEDQTAMLQMTLYVIRK